VKGFLLAMALLATGLGVGPPGAESSDLQPWLHNAAERTRAARRALATGDAVQAAAAARAAWRLRPDDPRTAYNLGSALLAAQDPQAPDILATAARLAANDPALAADALFNLGNAHLRAERWEEAAAAYRDVLRHRPGATDAKRNLEWVLRRLEQDPPPSPDASPPPPPEEEEGEGGAAPPPPPPPASPEEADPPPAEAPPPFQQQGDLTTEEAEGILAAVEDLERQQQQQRPPSPQQPPPPPSREVKDW